MKRAACQWQQALSTHFAYEKDSQWQQASLEELPETDVISFSVAISACEKGAPWQQASSGVSLGACAVALAAAYKTNVSRAFRQLSSLFAS